MIFQYIYNDQINMAVLYWYPVKSDASYATVHTVPYAGQATFYKVTKTHGHEKFGHP